MTEEMKNQLMEQISKVHVVLQHLEISASDNNIAVLNTCNVSLTEMIKLLNGETNKENK